jgi:hypothetical protein
VGLDCEPPRGGVIQVLRAEREQRAETQRLSRMDGFPQLRRVVPRVPDHPEPIEMPLGAEQHLGRVGDEVARALGRQAGLHQ